VGFLHRRPVDAFLYSLFVILYSESSAMPFSTLIGNDRIKKLLQRAVSDARIGQSLLMAGPRGVGKYRFAVALAQALNCEQPVSGDACGECLPCRKIARNEHADVRTILRETQDPSIKKESKSQFIKIEQTRLMSETGTVSSLRRATTHLHTGRRRMASSRSGQLAAKDPRGAARNLADHPDYSEAICID
jgi:DNA polymerase III gamma/tau subunit